jgi:zinc protease
VVDGDGGSVETVRESLPESLRLMAEVLRQPSFPDDEFEQLRRAALTGIDSQRSDPAALATLALTRHLNPYPPSHWLYTSSLDERTARLKGLSLDDVKHCYEEFYGASDSELSVVGDFDPEAVARLAQDLFGDWKSPRPYARIPLKVADVAPVNETIRTPDKANAVLRAGELLRLRDDDPDYPALLLGNYIFGGSSDSRLMRRIREKEGLSYSVGSFLSADSFYPRGAFGIFAIYAPQNRARVEEAMNDELRKAFADGFTPEEVEAGKKGFLQARQLSRSSDPAVAGRLVAYLVLGRTFAWDADLERKVAALTPQQVLDAMRRHIDPAKLTVVKAGDFANLAPNPQGPARAD